MPEHKYTIAVDFDGVIHSYTTPWVAPEVIPDPPVKGAIEWLNDISRRFDVVIFTTRGKTPEGREAVCSYLEWAGLRTDLLPRLVVAAEKPPALVYIDDRAWRFEGTFPTAHEIHQARPWNKPPPEVDGSPMDVTLAITLTEVEHRLLAAIIMDWSLKVGGLDASQYEVMRGIAEKFVAAGEGVKARIVAALGYEKAEAEAAAWLDAHPEGNLPPAKVPTHHKRDIILDFYSSPDKILNALHQAGWAVVPR